MKSGRRVEADAAQKGYRSKMKVYMCQAEAKKAKVAGRRLLGKGTGAVKKLEAEKAKQAAVQDNVFQCCMLRNQCRTEAKDKMTKLIEEYSADDAEAWVSIVASVGETGRRLLGTKYRQAVKGRSVKNTVAAAKKAED